MLLKEAFCDQMFLATTHNFLDLLILKDFSFSFCLVKGKLVRFYEKTRVYVSLKIFSYMMLTFKEVKLIAYCVHGNCDHLINIMPKFVLKSTESHCKHQVEGWLLNNYICFDFVRPSRYHLSRGGDWVRGLPLQKRFPKRSWLPQPKRRN